MTELQIRYFLTIAQEKSVSKTAELLYVSQPAVSKQLSQLEAELEIPLFIRHPQSMELTEAGIAFQQLFSEFNTRFRETLEHAKSSARAAKINYYLGCLDGWDISALCLDLFSHMEQRFPNVDIHITSCDINHVLQTLRKGDADSIITTAGLFENTPDIRIDPVADVNAVLLFSVRHPLAQKKRLCLRDFKDYPFYSTITQDAQWGQKDLIHLCRKSGFTPRIEYVPTLSDTYMQMHIGNGVFLTNDWILSKNNPSFRMLPLSQKRRIGLASLNERKGEVYHEIRDEIVKYLRFRTQQPPV